jgi:hypothetical protein
MNWKVTSLCLLALSAGSVAPARADTVFVEELADHYDDVAVSGFEFGTNQTPSRAWLDLVVYRRDLTGLGELDQYSIERAHVPGLSRIDDRIVFSSASRVTLCATVVHKRFLFVHYDDIVRTGRCTVSTTAGARQKDDGFTVQTVPVLDVYFNVRE